MTSDLMKRIPMASPEAMTFEIDGRVQRVSHTWFRGENCNFGPDAAALLTAGGVERFVIGQLAPSSPLIGPATNVAAFGSCFAEHISRWLASRDFNVLTKAPEATNVYVAQFAEALVTTFSLAQQFEWAFENKVFKSKIWHDKTGGEKAYDESVRQRTRSLFDKADIFILTLGLSEVWYDAITQEVFWHAVPTKDYDPARHKFRVSSVAENKHNLHEIYRIVKQHKPHAKIIFTLSPIPLVATFRPIPCMPANSASKAILRAALDEFFREIDDEETAFYWPSYEIINDVFSRPWMSDRRHVKREILDYVMVQFEKLWCHGTTPRYTLEEAWERAKKANHAA